LANLDYLKFPFASPVWQHQGVAEMRENDKQSMEETKIELVAAINTSKHRLKWTVNKVYSGSLCDYNIKIADFYKNKNEEIRQLDNVCPYAVSFDTALNFKV
jgi:hypothetical protein